MVLPGPGTGSCRSSISANCPGTSRSKNLLTVSDVATAIADMYVRGAGCIGATAGYGMWLAAREAKGSPEQLAQLADELIRTRPTASNLAWAVHRQLEVIAASDDWERAAKKEAVAIADEDAEWCRRIGEHGLALIKSIAAAKPAGDPVNILTHCNAGWLAFTDWGSATAPIYAAIAPASRFTFGSTKRGRAIKAPASRPGSWPTRACRIP